METLAKKVKINPSAGWSSTKSWDLLKKIWTSDNIYIRTFTTNPSYS